MKIHLDAKTIMGGHISVTEDIRQYYEKLFGLIVDEYKGNLVINSLDEIIITDQIVEGVKKYQREHGLIEEITDNDIGSAFGKTILDKRTGRQVVFLNAEEATFLLDDNVINQCCKDDEEKKQWHKRCDRIINLLIHELSHVEYYSLITTQTEFPHNNPFDYMLEFLAVVMFEEYYACRRASEVSIPFYREFVKETIANIENYADDLVEKIKNKEINPIEFHVSFFEYLQMALNEMCYLLGDIQSSKFAESELVGTKIYNIIDCIKKEFDDLYRSSCCERRALIKLGLRNAIIKYYRLFGIDFVADYNGISVLYL